MNHGVAVGANRNKVRFWIYFVFSTNICQRQNVVHVNEVLSNGTVSLFEIK